MARTKAQDDGSGVFVARESFSAEVDGEVFVVQKGITRVRAGHGLLKGNPDYFEPVDESVQYEVTTDDKPRIAPN